MFLKIHILLKLGSLWVKYGVKPFNRMVSPPLYKIIVCYIHFLHTIRIIAIFKHDFEKNETSFHYFVQNLPGTCRINSNVCSIHCASGPGPTAVPQLHVTPPSRKLCFSLWAQQHSLFVLLCVCSQACAPWPIDHSRLLFVFLKVAYCLCLNSGTIVKPGILFLIHFNGISFQHKWTCLCYLFLSSVTTIMWPIL